MRLTPWLLKAIDIGESAIFIVLCTRAFFVHFYKDFQRLRRRHFARRPLQRSDARNGN